MRRDLFANFCREYVRQLNRLRMEHRAIAAKLENWPVERRTRELFR